MAGKKKSYTFLQNDRMPQWKISLILSAVSLALLLGCIFAAFLVKGQAGTVLGAFGLIGVVFAVAAAVFGVRTLTGRKEDIRGASVSGICSGVLVIIWAAIILLGIH